MHKASRKRSRVLVNSEDLVCKLSTKFHAKDYFLKTKGSHRVGRDKLRLGCRQTGTKLLCSKYFWLCFYPWHGNKLCLRKLNMALYTRSMACRKFTVHGATSYPAISLCTVVGHSEDFSSEQVHEFYMPLMFILPFRFFSHLLPGFLLSSVTMGASLGKPVMMYFDLVKSSWIFGLTGVSSSTDTIQTTLPLPASWPE